MSKKQLIIFLSVILLSFLAIQPFNYICRLTGFCEPLILSYYLPKKTGELRFDVIFEAKDESEKLSFLTQSHSALLLTGENHEVKYLIKNESDEKIVISPRRYIFPFEAMKYLEFYECLCFREYKIKPKSSKLLSVKFRINPEIEKDPAFKSLKAIRIGYEISDD